MHPETIHDDMVSRTRDVLLCGRLHISRLALLTNGGVMVCASSVTAQRQGTSALKFDELGFGAVP